MSDTCIWCSEFDEICTNPDSPMCCDFCPVPDVAEVCRHEKRRNQEKEDDHV